MPSAKTYLIRCFLFLFFSAANTLSLWRAVQQQETASAYLSATTLSLTTIGFLYFGVAYIRRSRQAR